MAVEESVSGIVHAHAHGVGKDVEVSDPKWRGRQPGARVARRAGGRLRCSGPEDFGYLHARAFGLGGERVLVSRTGFTGEVGARSTGMSVSTASRCGTT
jgi:glycine cleavage system aminomethyltransferase T